MQSGWFPIGRCGLLPSLEYRQRQSYLPDRARNPQGSALAAKEALFLTTIRSHDQYDTTVYGLDDRCQGVFGRRDIVFMSQEDLANRGLADGGQIEICGLLGDEESHSIGSLTAVAYDIPRGSVAGYHPEMNPVMSLSRFVPQSDTPSYMGYPLQ
nr:molybdopterin dinucleotide binding domain-containing protein [Sinorhizobium medicae]